MSTYVKVIHGDKVYEGDVIKITPENEIILQLYNGRRLSLDSAEVTITDIRNDNY